MITYKTAGKEENGQQRECSRTFISPWKLLSVGGFVQLIQVSGLKYSGGFKGNVDLG